MGELYAPLARHPIEQHVDRLTEMLVISASRLPLRGDVKKYLAGSTSTYLLLMLRRVDTSNGLSITVVRYSCPL